jgi:predicted GTPase
LIGTAAPGFRGNNQQADPVITVVGKQEWRIRKMMEELIRWLVDEAATRENVANDISTSDTYAFAKSIESDTLNEVLDWIGRNR